jgi:hypothetical protein
MQPSRISARVYLIEYQEQAEIRAESGWKPPAAFFRYTGEQESAIRK